MARDEWKGQRMRIRKREKGHWNTIGKTAVSRGEGRGKKRKYYSDGAKIKTKTYTVGG